MNKKKSKPKSMWKQEGEDAKLCSGNVKIALPSVKADNQNVPGH